MATVLKTELTHKNPEENKNKVHVIGHKFEDHKLIIFGKPTVKEGIDSWSGLDGLYRWEVLDNVRRWVNQGYHVIIDMNSTLAGKGTILGLAAIDIPVDVIGFHYTDEQVAIDRMDGRATNNNHKVGWDAERYSTSQAKKANKSTLKIRDASHHWGKVAGTKRIIAAETHKEWLIEYFYSE